jgi:hypothetical protein
LKRHGISPANSFISSSADFYDQNSQFPETLAKLLKAGTLFFFPWPSGHGGKVSNFKRTVNKQV